MRGCAALATLTLLAAAACGGAPPRPSLVLLVSFDTTRADAIGCYGNARSQTPVIDGLAREGTRFAWALAQASTTLSSHATVMSGLDAHGHEVTGNGHPVRADVPLLAERFRAAGWDTIAVVGSVALAGNMGLTRGFRVYDERFAHPDQAGDEDRADGVTQRALAALDARPARGPLFLFVHYYDPHMSWDSAPPSVRARFVDPAYHGFLDGSVASHLHMQELFRQRALQPADLRQAWDLYLAEIAWTDQELGVLLDGLRARGLADHALVAVLADHGEAMADTDGTLGHGAYADPSNIHVPLVLHGPGVPAGRVVEQPVRLMDVAPTLLHLAGLEGGLGKGVDLSPLLGGEGEPGPPSFAEATLPRRLRATEGWPNRSLERSVERDGFLLLRSPYPQRDGRLLRLGAEAIPIPDAERRRSLEALLDAWEAAAPAVHTPALDPETERRLRSLGYLE